MRNLKSLAWAAFAFFLIWSGCKACSIDESKSTISTSTTDQFSNEKPVADITQSEYNTSALLNSADQFKSKMNNFFDELNLDLQIRNFKIEDGAVNNTFQVMMNEHIGIIGSLNKSDNSVKEISMMGQGDGTTASGANIMFVMVGMIAACDPDLPAEERGEIMKELGLLDKNMDINNLKNSTIRNGLKYWVVSNNITGLSFGVSKNN
jgi:hypothetical protein